MWLDSHCHVNATDFAADREEVLARAREAGVEALVVIGSGYGIESAPAAIALAHAHDDVYATAGLHPHDAERHGDASHTQLRAWLADARVMAVGECGLDYHYMNSPREAQRAAFAAQVALARELDLPVSIHVRGDGPEAYDELLDIWIAEGRGDVDGVLHCYTGSLEFAQRALDHRFVVSFSGIVTFKKASDLRDVARGLPLERLLVETDAPFLAPQGHRGRRNEPAFVPVVGAVLAEVKNVSTDELARITTSTARRFYRLPEAHPHE